MQYPLGPPNLLGRQCPTVQHLELAPVAATQARSTGRGLGADRHPDLHWPARFLDLADHVDVRHGRTLGAPRQTGDVTSLIFVLGGLAVIAVGRYGYVHADDRRRMGGGIASWMTPSTRRFWSVCPALIGVAMAIAGALA